MSGKIIYMKSWPLHQVRDNICKPMLDSSMCWAEGVLMDANMMSAIKVVVRVFQLGLGHKG